MCPVVVHKRKWQIFAAVGGIALGVGLLILSIQPKRSGPPHALLVIWDCSRSANDVYNRVIPWGIRLFQQVPTNARFVMCRMSRQTVTVVNFSPLPKPETIQQDFPKLLSPDKHKGTRPLSAIQYACQFAQRYKGWLIAVAMFTDGQNDYPSDTQELQNACRALVAKPNVVRVGLFGLDPLDRRSVADWENHFNGSSKVTICTRHLGNTEDGINEFCELFERDVKQHYIKQRGEVEAYE